MSVCKISHEPSHRFYLNCDKAVTCNSYAVQFKMAAAGGSKHNNGSNSVLRMLKQNVMWLSAESNSSHIFWAPTQYGVQVLTITVTFYFFVHILVYNSGMKAGRHSFKESFAFIIFIFLLRCYSKNNYKQVFFYNCILHSRNQIIRFSARLYEQNTITSVKPFLFFMWAHEFYCKTHRCKITNYIYFMKLWTL